MPKPISHRPVAGAQVLPANARELRRLLGELTADDLAALDPSLGAWMNRPLGREMLATTVLASAGSIYICLYNLEPAGLVLVERGENAARIRALAIAPDMRRKRLAHTLLGQVIAKARERAVPFLWMELTSTNEAAVRVALALGFRRVLPQFLRRESASLLPASLLARVQAERVEADADTALEDWQDMESEAGDAWARDLIMGDLFNVLVPRGGSLLRLRVDGREMGGALAYSSSQRAQLHLWLRKEAWNTPEEIACVRAALNTIESSPIVDVFVGSGGHLRASVARYKELGFRPMLKDKQVLAFDMRA